MTRTLTGTLLAATALAVLAGCSTYDSVTQRIAQHITPYRITIVQGNFVSKEAASQMRVGMSRDEVKKLLGTPLLTDMFHANRWDYVFYFKRGSTSVVQQRDFVVHFEGDRVASWTGGEDLPSNLELLAEIDGDRSGRRARAKAAAAAASAPAASAAAAATPASAPAEGSEAAAAAVGASAPETARTPSSELGNAAAALPTTDPNAQAADAANRATSAVTTPSGLTPSARANTPPQAGLPPNAGTMPQQIQLHRQPPPAPNGPPPNPVGPTAGSQGTGETSPPPAQNPSLAAPPAVPASGTAGSGQ